MKILLIRPPETLYGKTPAPSCGLPLGIAYIAGVIKKYGCSVKILDFLVCREFCVSPAAGGGVSYGAPWRTIRERIAAEKPDIVGISNAFTAQFENAARMAEAVKDISRKIFVIAGGAHPSVRPRDFFQKSNSVDAVVVGEGEETFREIVGAVRAGGDLSGIKGLVYRKNGEVFSEAAREHIADLDGIPFPAYELLDMEEYFSKKYQFFSRPTFIYPGSERTVNMITSRGCPHHCVFCSIHTTMGYKWRAHSAGYVSNHINFLKKEFGIAHIHIEDDNLTLDSGRFEKILDGLAKTDKPLTWDTPNGIRADNLSEDILRKCKKSGCVYMIMGVESGDQRVLNEIIGKKLLLEKVERVSGLCKKIKLNMEAFFMVGLPGETRQNIKNTVRFALRLHFKYGVYPILFLATPLPGTRLYEICLEKHYIRREIPYEKIPSSILETGAFETEYFTSAYLRKIFRGFIFLRGWIAAFDFLRFSALHFPLFASRLKILSEKLPRRLLLRNFIRYKFFRR